MCVNSEDLSFVMDFTPYNKISVDVRLNTVRDQWK